MLPALLILAANPLPPDPLKAQQWARQNVTIAAVQYPQAFDTATVQQYVNRAATDGAELVLFPEYIMGNVHLSVDRAGAYANERVAAVSEAAKAAGIYVLIGSWVLWGNTTTPVEKQYTNSILIFGRDGRIEGMYNKTHPAVGGPPYFWPPLDTHHGEWAMYWGQSYPVFDFDFARVGIQTCYDGYFPEVMRSLALQGAEVVLWPNSRGGFIRDDVVSASSFWNFVSIVAVDAAVGYGTQIFDHGRGKVAYCAKAEECYLAARLDLHALRVARKHSRMFHQRRPDLAAVIATDWQTSEFYDGYPE